MLEKYALLCNYICSEPPPIKEYKETTKVLLPDAKDITLASYTPGVSEIITAHNLREYRVTHKGVSLLPDIPCILDTLVEQIPDDWEPYL